MSDIITDNSQVNLNLLKKLSDIREFCKTRQTLECRAVLKEFFPEPTTDRVTHLLSELSEEEKQELKLRL